MVSWRAHNFECADVATVERFMSWLSDYGLVEIPPDTPEEVVMASLAQEKQGDEKPADAARVGAYLYTHSTFPKPDLLADSIEFWDRAAEIEFDATTGTCTEARLYAADAGEPTEIATYEGASEYGGLDVAYRCYVEHDFRFRCFAVDSPSMHHVRPIPGAEHELEFDEEGLAELIDVTGVEPTPEQREALLDE